MELSIKYVVTSVVVVIVLVVLSFFITTTSSTQTSQSTAGYVFSTKCQEYRQRGCDWSVTYDTDFTQYVSACKQLFGEDKAASPERRAATCLYDYCEGCKKFEASQLECNSLASSCKGLVNTANDPSLLATCCSQYRSQCSGEPQLVQGVC